MTYLFVLAFIVIGSCWLELVVRTRVFRRGRRLLATLGIALLPFILWDLYAIAAGQWWFDEGQLAGVTLPGGLPLEELLFFPVVGLAAILTLEAVRGVRDT
ncbi:MAG: lycopene cyclase domain-containing protein [Candidatus Nanopelagicales bacterium]